MQTEQQRPITLLWLGKTHHRSIAALADGRLIGHAKL